MAVNFGNPTAAASAYANMAKMVASSASDNASSAASASAAPKVSFGDMLETATRSSIDSLRTGEKASAAAVTGTMDPLAITQAVTAARMTLDTFTAVRDAAVDAYNKIQGMPI